MVRGLEGWRVGKAERTEGGGQRTVDRGLEGWRVGRWMEESCEP